MSEELDTLGHESVPFSVEEYKNARKGANFSRSIVDGGRTFLNFGIGGQDDSSEDSNDNEEISQSV